MVFEFDAICQALNPAYIKHASCRVSEHTGSIIDNQLIDQAKLK